MQVKKGKWGYTYMTKTPSFSVDSFHAYGIIYAKRACFIAAVTSKAPLVGFGLHALPPEIIFSRSVVSLFAKILFAINAVASTHSLTVVLRISDIVFWALILSRLR
jgi:hypothetical protein